MGTMKKIFRLILISILAVPSILPQPVFASPAASEKVQNKKVTAPAPFPVTLKDAAGRSVMKQTLVASRSGAVNLDARQLSAGIYLVRFDFEYGQ